MDRYPDSNLRSQIVVAALAAITAWPLEAVAQMAPPPTQTQATQPQAMQPQRLASAGLWTAFAATQADRQICGIATTGADGRQIVVQQLSGESGIQVALEKPSWSIPDATVVDLAFQFDGGTAVGERANGSGTRLTVDLPFDRSVAFMRSFRYGGQIQVHFPNGNEPVWTGGLRGSSAMVDTFNDCRSRFVAAPLNGPTQPFAPAAPAQPHG
jgi:uncharacterized iron-regulated membrane protein